VSAMHRLPRRLRRLGHEAVVAQSRALPVPET
jgi:hypothetical protein